MGARPLRRAIQRFIEDPLSEKLLYKEFGAGQKIIVDTIPDPESDSGEEILSFTAVEGFEPPALEFADTADTADTADSEVVETVETD